MKPILGWITTLEKSAIKNLILNNVTITDISLSIEAHAVTAYSRIGLT